MIKVAMCQRGNKLLEFLTTTSFSFDSSVNGDYEVGTTSLLFLSLKFHATKPEYIHKRIAKWKNSKLRIIMVYVDVHNYHKILEELFATLSITIVVCKNYEECSKYLRGFDICCRRSSQVLRKKESTVDNFLEAFPKMNKTNSEIIQGKFNTLQDFISCDTNSLSVLFGIGTEKARSISSYFKKPFKEL